MKPLFVHVWAAVLEAKKSKMTHKHGAIIVYRGEIVSIGHNMEANFLCHAFSLHAEQVAIARLPKRFKINKQLLQELWMLVVRVSGKDAHLNMSCPCSKCVECIMETGIPTVYYSTRESNYLQML